MLMPPNHLTFEISHWLARHWPTSRCEPIAIWVLVFCFQSMDTRCAIYVDKLKFQTKQNKNIKKHQMTSMNSDGGRGLASAPPRKKIFDKNNWNFFLAPLIYNLAPLNFFSCSTPVYKEKKTWISMNLI